MAQAIWNYARDVGYTALETGQRVTGTRQLDERDVRNGQIWVLQGKTNAKRRIEITGELKVLVDRIMLLKKEHKVRSTRLIVSEDGTSMTVAILQGRFDLARGRQVLPSPSFKCGIYVRKLARTRLNRVAISCRREINLGIRRS